MRCFIMSTAIQVAFAGSPDTQRIVVASGELEALKLRIEEGLNGMKLSEVRSGALRGATRLA